MANTDFQSLTAHPAVRQLMEIARAGGGAIRMVGGAVRDTLLGRPAGEIDLASSLPPENMAMLLKMAGIKSVPTGIEHGTLTAVIEGKGYEITTLRRDIETDGRHAKVEFTDDWQADAARRDFTINALYVDGDGKLYDYCDGQKDLAAGRVRFIGDAGARIREDVLRILRFFRFHAWFGQGAADAEGLAACRAMAKYVPTLSVERVWRELVKLLAAPDPEASWRLMLGAKILAEILPEADDIERLELLLALETKNEVQALALRRLAALLPESGEIATLVAQRLKMSKREAVKLHSLATLPALMHGKLDPVPFRHAIYMHGVEDAMDAALLLTATEPASDLEPVFAAAAAWNEPHFPLQGQDLLALGMKQGPAMGKLLKEIEESWIAADFRLTLDECLALARGKLSTAL